MDRPLCCRGVRGALNKSGCSVSDTQPPPGAPFGGFLGGEGVRLKGLMSVLGAPERLKLVVGILQMCHAPCMSLSENWATVPCLLGGNEEP